MIVGIIILPEIIILCVSIILTAFSAGNLFHCSASNLEASRGIPGISMCTYLTWLTGLLCIWSFACGFSVFHTLKHIISRERIPIGVLLRLLIIKIEMTCSFVLFILFLWLQSIKYICFSRDQKIMGISDVDGYCRVVLQYETIPFLLMITMLVLAAITIRFHTRIQL